MIASDDMSTIADSAAAECFDKCTGEFQRWRCCEYSLGITAQSSVFADPAERIHAPVIVRDTDQVVALGLGAVEAQQRQQFAGEHSFNRHALLQEPP